MLVVSSLGRNARRSAGNAEEPEEPEGRASREHERIAVARGRTQENQAICKGSAAAGPAGRSLAWEPRAIWAILGGVGQ